MHDLLHGGPNDGGVVVLADMKTRSLTDAMSSAGGSWRTLPRWSDRLSRPAVGFDA